MPRLSLSVVAMLAGSLAAAACDGEAGMDMGMGMMPDGGVTPGNEPLGTLPGTQNPFRLVRGRGAEAGRPLDLARFYAELGAADAVCLGEQHDDDDHHAAQLMVLDHLMSAAAGKRMAMGMEMVERQFQPALDDFAAGRIDERAMLTRTQWQQRWRFDYALYRPLVARTLQAGAALLALNAATEIRTKIRNGGLDSLTAEERAEVPMLDTGNAEHRAWFERVAGHAVTDGTYLIQVLWDETMADTAWRWLSAQAGAPRQIALIAGMYHCVDFGIPSRIRRRGATKVLSVRPVIPGAAVTDAISEGQTDYLIVYGR